jgi:hypothetical protein
MPMHWQRRSLPYQNSRHAYTIIIEQYGAILLRANFQHILWLLLLLLAPQTWC